MGDFTNFYKEAGIPTSENEIKFQTYLSYTEQIFKFVKKEYGTATNLFGYVCKNTKLKKSTFKIDESILKRFLYIGWNTEYLLSKNDNKATAEIIRISNHWKPIQAYYAVYSIGEALVYLNDGIAKESHKGCVDRLNNFLVETIKIEPWCFAYKGPNTPTAINFPKDVARAHNLSQLPVKPVDMINTCLLAEHRKQISEYTPKPLTERQKQSGMKKTLKKNYDPGYTTILDFLYRLRIKSNYKDAEIFITDAPDTHIKSFSSGLSWIVYSTMGLLEVLIIKRCGLEMFTKICENYRKILGENNAPILDRLNTYKNFTQQV